MRKSILIFSAFLSFLIIEQVKAQEKVISGTVTSKGENSMPLPGVNVVVKGTSKGVQTDFDGRYSIEASSGQILEFSYIGFTSITVQVDAITVIDVAMEESLEQLDDVVVTALGIQKSRKSLTYAAQDISAAELTKVKDVNPVNSLSGKIAGVVVNRSASGVGGSVKLTLRGNTSTRDNQPLYVIDGIPLLNNSAIQPNNSFGDIENAGNRDGGDALSLLNPEDIESITVLKGASASALYGSQGSNGVVLITTKKGKAGKFKTSFSSNVTVDQAAYLLDFNDRAQDNVDDFFDVGTTTINAMSISGGTENAQTYFSYTNTFASGVIPTHKVKKHTLNVRETAQLLDNKMKVDASILLSTQSIRNKPISGFYYNPLVGTYAFNSETENLSNYETFEEFNSERNLLAQRWFRATSDIEQNPYWILNRNASDDENQKLLASLSLQYKFNDWLTIQTRGSYDKNFYKFERKIHATTDGTLSAPNGRYLYNDVEDTQLYGDIIAILNADISESFSISANVGTSIRKSDLGKSVLLDSGVRGDLKIPNIFTLSNFVVGTTGVNPILEQRIAEQKEVQSIFASTTLGYNDLLFLDLTARNDWSSTVSDPFFYPSVGLTAMLSEIFELPESITYAKIRASYAEVGNDIQSFVNNPINTIGTGAGGLTPPTILPLTELQPETQRSFEIGTEWKFFNNRLGFDLGYYKTNTIDQFMLIDGGVAADFLAINAGDFENKGIEASITLVPIQNDNVRWDANINFAQNDNEIKELDPRLGRDFLELTPIDVNSYALLIRKGGSFGDIYGRKLRKTPGGLPIRNADGNFTQADPDQNTRGGFDLLGNANPDFALGWNNSITYKNFTLNFLIDAKFGGEVMSLTEAAVDGFGTLNRTGEVRIFDEATNAETTIPAREYYQMIGGRNGLTSEYIYDATNIRLAELSFGYNFKLQDNSFFTSITASIIGRNLFFFYKDAPYDPNISLSTANGLQGIDIFGSPSTQSIGLNVGLSF
ncbi:TonB-dependent receptor plug domain-containing protein [Aquimarina mytili]|uniref:TonB-dependent receptor plug domain-containing protein n=1 Tax=Aquimarina mytili TaxID=874423 RepID=A0A936ZTK0_9FLAO|nr:TonB-dependent receptor plug domain-containing protein [Aquimarina mytili]MBL0684438.1 TonB-dependent receptor plug domain-containing protein [Aquimarina mytili]